MDRDSQDQLDGAADEAKREATRAILNDAVAEFMDGMIKELPQGSKAMLYIATVDGGVITAAGIPELNSAFLGLSLELVEQAFISKGLTFPSSNVVLPEQMPMPEGVAGDGPNGEVPPDAAEVEDIAVTQHGPDTPPAI